MATRTDAEQRHAVADVDEFAADPPVDDAHVLGDGGQDATFGQTRVVDGGEGEFDAVPADDLHGRVGELERVDRALVVRVGGEQPDLLALTTVGADLAGDPVTVVGVRDVAHRARRRDGHGAFGAGTDAVGCGERTLHGVRVAVLVDDDGGEQLAVGGQARVK